MDYQKSRGFAKDTREHVKPTLRVGYFSTREHMSSCEEVRLEMEIYALAGSL
ncbi:hypothetical protein YC2023_033555 [Brassica napus]